MSEKGRTHQHRESALTSSTNIGCVMRNSTHLTLLLHFPVPTHPPLPHFLFLRDRFFEAGLDDEVLVGGQLLPTSTFAQYAAMGVIALLGVAGFAAKAYQERKMVRAFARWFVCWLYLGLYLGLYVAGCVCPCMLHVCMCFVPTRACVRALMHLHLACVCLRHTYMLRACVHMHACILAGMHV